MNISHRVSKYTVFSVVLGALFCGCQGLQGIRYHEDLTKLAGEDAALVGHDAGFEVGMGDDVGGDGSSPAPHPRFHPLPTRPVFEPKTLAAAEMGASEVESPQSVPAPVDQTASSVLTSTSKPNVELASASSTKLLSQMLPSTELPSEKEGELTETSTTSRRKVEPESAPQPVAELDDEPPAFAPVKPTAPSANDGWRPRVASP